MGLKAENKQPSEQQTEFQNKDVEVMLGNPQQEQQLKDFDETECHPSTDTPSAPSAAGQVGDSNNQHSSHGLSDGLLTHLERQEDVNVMPEKVDAEVLRKQNPPPDVFLTDDEISESADRAFESGLLREQGNAEYQAALKAAGDCLLAIETGKRTKADSKIMQRAYERLGKVKFQQKLYTEAIEALSCVEKSCLSENCMKILEEAEVFRDEEIKMREKEQQAKERAERQDSKETKRENSNKEARETVEGSLKEVQQSVEQEQAKREKYIAGMVELLEKMRHLKSEGNSLFKKECYESAVDSYKQCLRDFDLIDLEALEPSQIEESQDLQNICRLNIAACCIKSQSSYEDAVAMCNLVLEKDPDNPKAFFRRSQAKLAIGDVDGAMQDAISAQSLVPDDVTIAAHLSGLKDAATQRSKEKQEREDLARQTENVDQDAGEKDDSSTSPERQTDHDRVTLDSCLAIANSYKAEGNDKFKNQVSRLSRTWKLMGSDYEGMERSHGVLSERDESA
eukprot:763971-Hanusia_phi.AAC.2